MTGATSRYVPLTLLIRATALTLSVLSIGCAAELRDPDRFPDVPPCRTDLNVPVLFQARCNGGACHGAGESPAAGLDLTSDGVAERLIGVESEMCAGLSLVDRDDPSRSFLLGKLVGPPAGCGDRMPIIGFLSVDEIGCVESWANEVVEQLARDADADADAGAVP